MEEQNFKMRKRIRILTMCLICVIGRVWCNGIRAFALTTDDGYEYEVVEGGDTVEITGYSGEDTEIIIPDIIDGKNVTSIGDYAFFHCTRLTSITIPKNVTSIGEFVFFDCDSLINIVVDSQNQTYESRESNAIIKTSSNTLIAGCGATTIPDDVTSIGDYAFYGCTSLTSITIPNSVISIGDCAFRECTYLTSITIPDSVTSIGGGAFEGCTRLTSITIPDSVASIGGYAFYDCTSLTSITIPKNVTSIGEGAFYQCDSLISIVVDSQNQTYESRNSNAIIEKSSNTLIVGCGATTIPNGVISIGFRAFYGCTYLTSITIPNGVTNIGEWAFYGCTSLTNITIPDSVTSIGDYVFWDCTSLASITIPDSVTSIGDSAFCNCDSLTSITIPDSVTSIASWAFAYCDSLTSITIANGEMSIAGDAFQACPETMTIYTVKGSSVEQWAKDNNIKVEALDGDTPEEPDTPENPNTPQNPNTPNTSDNGQMEGEGTQTTLPKVGTKYTVSNGVYKVIKSTATSKEVTFTKQKNSKKTCLTILATIKIDGQTYKVTEITSKAFKNSKTLKSVTIGKNVKKIGKEAFSGCKKLNKITIKSTVLKSVGKNAIKGIKAKATIKCPKKQLSKYKKLFNSKTGYKKTMKIKK